MATAHPDENYDKAMEHSTRRTIMRLVAEAAGTAPERLKPTDVLSHVGADQDDLEDIFNNIEDEFSIILHGDERDSVETAEDIIQIVLSKQRDDEMMRGFEF